MSEDNSEIIKQDKYFDLQIEVDGAFQIYQSDAEIVIEKSAAKALAEKLLAFAES